MRYVLPLLFLSTLLTTHPQDCHALELATFSADITPPLHRRVCVGFIPEFTEVLHPLLAKGIVLREGEATYVLCALDYEGLCNDSYDLFRERIAKAAGTTVSRVAVQSLHQHTAPVFDANTDRLLYRDDPEKLKSGLDAAEQAVEAIATAVRQSLTQFQPATHLATGMAVVDRVASSRRIVLPDGSILARHSAGGVDPKLRDAPEGLIDPWVRTITFYAPPAKDEPGRPLVRLHYYATHPQSRSEGNITPDVPGLARERLERESGVYQVYFTGCGGNIAFGKYNDGSMASREALTERMHAGLKKASDACDSAKRQPVTPLRWNTRDVNFPLRRDGEFTLEAARQIAADKTVPSGERLRKAMLTTWLERAKSGRPVEFSGWSMGNVSVVHLPGEPFVQFQLAAQKAFPDRFIAVAGYGECAMWYIGEDRIYTDRGGYEQSWSFVAPCESLVMETMEYLIRSE